MTAMPEIRGPAGPRPTTCRLPEGGAPSRRQVADVEDDIAHHGVGDDHRDPAWVVEGWFDRQRLRGDTAGAQGFGEPEHLPVAFAVRRLQSVAVKGLPSRRVSHLSSTTQSHAGSGIIWDNAGLTLTPTCPRGRPWPPQRYPEGPWSRAAREPERARIDALQRWS